MLKITAIVFLFLDGFNVRFDGVVNSAPTPARVTHSRTKRYRPPKRFYDPNHGYEPYWPGGDWVLYGDPGKASTEPPPEICGDECHYLYQEVGEICGRNIDNLAYEGCDGNNCYRQDDYSKGYQTFETYCEFMDTQCKSANMTKPAFPRWIFVHHGPCLDDHNATYYKPMYKSEDPVSRLEFYLESMDDTFKGLGQTPC